MSANLESILNEDGALIRVEMDGVEGYLFRNTESK